MANKQASQAIARLVLEANLTKPSPTTAEILGLLMQAEEMGYQRGIAKPRRFGSESCTVCGLEWVDVEGGFDTCGGCLSRMQS